MTEKQLEQLLQTKPEQFVGKFNKTVQTDKPFNLEEAQRIAFNVIQLALVGLDRPLRKTSWRADAEKANP